MSLQPWALKYSIMTLITLWTGKTEQEFLLFGKNSFYSFVHFRVKTIKKITVIKIFQQRLLVYSLSDCLGGAWIRLDMTHAKGASAPPLHLRVSAVSSAVCDSVTVKKKKRGTASGSTPQERERPGFLIRQTKSFAWTTTTNTYPTRNRSCQYYTHV